MTPPDAARPLRVLIADDEPLARERLRDLLAARDDVTLVAECADGAEAVAAIRAHRPDLALLDVQMPEPDGVGVLEALAPEERPAVVFVTAHDRYALRAFDLHAIDYLLKPFSDDRFDEALGRAADRLSRGEHDAFSPRQLAHMRPPADDQADGEADPDAGDDTGRLDRVAVRIGSRWRIVEADEIDWIEGAGVYARLVVGERTFLLRTSLAELERRLDPERFVRIHRSTIARLDRVREVLGHAHGEYVLVLRDGTRLKVSRTYSERVRSFLERIT